MKHVGGDAGSPGGLFPDHDAEIVALADFLQLFLGLDGLALAVHMRS
jgi:hypothetical protein